MVHIHLIRRHKFLKQFGVDNTKIDPIEYIVNSDIILRKLVFCKVTNIAVFFNTLFFVFHHCGKYAHRKDLYPVAERLEQVFVSLHLAAWFYVEDVE